MAALSSRARRPTSRPMTRCATSGWRSDARAAALNSPAHAALFEGTPLTSAALRAGTWGAPITGVADRSGTGKAEIRAAQKCYAAEARHFNRCRKALVRDCLIAPQQSRALDFH